MREIDDVYALMMEALDGELTEAGQAELESHLRARPDLAREWRAMQAIDTLFKQTPPLAPAGDFAQRTLARLPDRRQRWLFVGAIYVLLFISGAIPLAGILWIILNFGPALTQPAFFQGLLQAAGELLRLIQVGLIAFLNGTGELIAQQPSLIGWLLAMVGIIFVWGGVYSQLVLRPSRT